MRELTEYEKQLIDALIKENETLRFVIQGSHLQSADPLANTTLIILTLKELIREVKSLKTYLGVPTPSLIKEAEARKLDKAIAKVVEKKKESKEKPQSVEKKEPPPPFVQFQLTKENIAKLFTKPEEARSVIVQRLLDAGCAIGIDKLVEMGYIENVRRYECRMKVNG